MALAARAILSIVCSFEQVIAVAGLLEVSAAALRN